MFRDKIFKRVLCIDDNEMDNRVTKIIMQSCDFAQFLHFEKSAEEGIRFLEKAGEITNEIPDIIFLDIQMPGMDGFAFLDLFAKLNDTIKNKSEIIMLTSSIDIVDYQRAMSNPYVKNYLKKPLNTLELLALTPGKR